MESFDIKKKIVAKTFHELKDKLELKQKQRTLHTSHLIDSNLYMNYRLY